MKPVRQIDVAHLMLNAKKFTGRFARALLDGTRDELLVTSPPQRVRDITPDQQSMMEQETEAMLKHADSIRANYGNDVLDLTAASIYVERLLSNSRIQRYIAKHHQETLATLTQLLEEIDRDKQQARPTTPSPAVNGTGEFPDTSQAVQALQ